MNKCIKISRYTKLHSTTYNSIQIQYISFCKVDLLSITNGSRCCTNTYVKDHLLRLQQHNSVIYCSRNIFLKKGDCWKNGWSSFIPIEMLRTITIEETFSLVEEVVTKLHST